MVWRPDYVAVDGAGGLRDYATRSGLTMDDTFLTLAASTASRAVDGHTHRQFGQVAALEARRYDACWDRRRRVWVVEIDDLQDATGLVVTVAAGPVTGFELEPVNALKVGKVYERLIIPLGSANSPARLVANEVTATALWGWTAFPAAVKQATMLQASRFMWRRDAPAGVAGSPDQGSEIRLLAKLDPDVAVSLIDYIRWWGAAG